MAGATSALELIQRLISFPTVSRDSNLELISYVQSYLSDCGITSELFTNAEGTKANLLAVVGSVGADNGGEPFGIILSGHTDVVPTDGQPWSNDPFAPWTEGERLYGRGACDMKGFIGIVLSRVPDMVERNLIEPIILALSFDEEVGCTGVMPMIMEIARRAPRPRLCIVGEPTEMRVINAHKGLRAFKTSIRGKAGHSSAPHLGANAISAAAKMIAFIDQLAEDAQAAEHCDGKFFPPFTTFNVGEISGGIAMNIIAAEVEFVWEFRPLPGFDSDRVISRFRKFADQEVLPGLRETAPEAKINFSELANVPPLLAEGPGDAESLVLQLAQRNATETVAYTTEAGHFQTAGHIPTVVCGPGSIDQAHTPDEYIELSQIAAGERFIDRLLDVLAAD